MPKKRVQATIREDLLKWLDEQVEQLVFSSRSHGLEVALLRLKSAMESEKESSDRKKRT